MQLGIGQPALRKEDGRLLTGRGTFSDDLELEGQLHAVMVRCPHAHAEIRGIRTQRARQSPGVVIVLTGRDYAVEQLQPIPRQAFPPDLPLVNSDGSPCFVPPDYPIAIDKVRHAGEVVAVVVAETRVAAMDAAEQVEVDYNLLPVVVDVGAALAPGAPILWEGRTNNFAIDGSRGDRDSTEKAFARAAHITRMEIRNNRVSGVPLEPAAAVAEYDAAQSKLTLHAGGQGVLVQKEALCRVLQLRDDQVRVICRDVGGGFGTKNILYREYALISWASCHVGRPVKWRGERSEAFVFDPYGRDLTSTAELALDAQGRFLGLRIHSILNCGSQVLMLMPLVRGASIANGLYVIPAMHIQLQAVLTNTAPTSTYRGAGRPEAMYLIERLIDTAAREIGLNRTEIRRNNMIRPEMLPYVNAVGTKYDSGQFQANMFHALAMADAAGFQTRRKASEAAGKFRGFGFANYIETATGIPPERAIIRVFADRIDITLGTQASGQGHETAFSQMVVDFLGVPFDRVHLLHGDTDIVRMGSGSHSSRSMRLGGLLLGQAATQIIMEGKRLAARSLQADENEVTFANGEFRVENSDRSITLFNLADLCRELGGHEIALLEASAEITTPLPTYPNGCHVCEVEIDPETAEVTIVHYSAVDDVGRVINPIMVDGQTHGGIVQGLGQALMEDCVYDLNNGQLLSGSLMDYAMPRAFCCPSFKLENNEVLAPSNPLGIKGAGEGGTTGAPPAIINAVIDALEAFRIRDIPMPVTSQRVWEAMRLARSMNPSTSSQLGYSLPTDSRV